jgi:hypothetical protein
MNVYDIVVYDYMGGSYTSASPDNESVGGAPFACIQVVKGLVERGLNVAVINDFAGDAIIGGARYVSRNIAASQKWGCKTLFQQRTGDAPPWIKRERMVVALHDKPGWHLKTLTDRIGREQVEFVAVSKWQAGLYPAEMKCAVIPNILPDIVYETSQPWTWTPGRFIYASAASRGLAESVSLWRGLKACARVADSTFAACAPAYDPIKDTYSDVELLHSLSFPELVRQMARSEGLFYYNHNSETFSIIAALAEALGRKTHVLCKYDPGAIPDTVNSQLVTRDPYQFAKDFVDSYGYVGEQWVPKAKDYSAKMWMPMWMNVLMEDR